MGPKKKIKDLSHLYSLVQLEKEPAPLTEEDVKNLLIPLSYKSHAYTMSLWAEFSADCYNHETYNPMFGTAPTVYRVQMYLLWLAETRTGLLEENITDTTVRNRLSAENKDIENYIEKELVYKGKISTDAYKKPVAPLLVAEDLI
ncbi:unnamed protein product [Alternaria alternata]